MWTSWSADRQKHTNTTHTHTYIHTNSHHPSSLFDSPSLLSGILPSIDNWAHLFGFIFGLCIATAFRPYKSIMGNPISTVAKALIIIVSVVIAVCLFTILILLFYVEPVRECDWCSYFTCVPFTATFCDGMYIDLKEL